ncbi:MAG: cysteine--tRNA ligase [Firmicutes bacterium]|nr:cysteine--tRNA ligase [Bacillota bacterium]
MRIYNTLTREKEEFVPLRDKKVGMYVCGPTVYDFFHIGNAYPFVVMDSVRRYLEYRGYDVTYVKNLTDIDDKMIKRARELNISVGELAERFIREYFVDADALGIRRAEFHPRATDHVPEIIALIQKLIQKEHAYPVGGGDVFFDTRSFKGYGKVSRQNLEELEAGARVEVDERKRYPLDFVLWKAEKPGEPSWDSPWGKGRPGWHIECSAMAMKYLGETLDIHAGGPDLVFPHHENESAQSEAATGKLFVRYWMHTGFLKMGQEKMSKSLGNVLNIRELSKRFGGETLRFFLLSAHYRTPLEFSEENLTSAGTALQRLRNSYENIRHRVQAREALGENPNESGAGAERLLAEVRAGKTKFITSMDDDFNTGEALGAFFEIARSVNTLLGQESSPPLPVLRQIREVYRELGGVLGILTPEARDAGLEADLEDLIRKREEARRQKDWAQADQIRADLLDRGIVLEDTSEGVRWKKALPPVGAR